MSSIFRKKISSKSLKFEKTLFRYFIYFRDYCQLLGYSSGIAFIMKYPKKKVKNNNNNKKTSETAKLESAQKLRKRKNCARKLTTR